MTDNDCLIWTGAAERGYGRMRWQGGKIQVHKWVWLQTGRELKEGYELHHKCGRKLCVNVDHLEALTRSEHYEIHQVGKWRRRMTHCFRGHPFSKENTRWNPSGTHRRCKTCASEYGKKYLAKKKLLG